MSKLPVSLTEFVLEEEHKIVSATGSLTILLTQIAYAAKIIGSHVKKAGLVDILEQTGARNASSDEVKKIDVLSNQVLIDVLSSTKAVVAGYILYGSSDMFVYSAGNTVNGFTLDPSIGSFLLSHEKMIIPNEGDTYAVNEGNAKLWDRKMQMHIESLKTNHENKKKTYKLRYTGALVADVHRILLKGGLQNHKQKRL